MIASNIIWIIKEKASKLDVQGSTQYDYYLRYHGLQQARIYPHSIYVGQIKEERKVSISCLKFGILAPSIVIREDIGWLI